jgi:lipoprotein-anchoring transpeptidase ErfK/SrfK
VIGVIMDAAYEDRYLPGTRLAGHDLSGLTAAEAAPVLDQIETELTLRVTVGGATREANGRDLGIALDRARTLASLAQGSTQKLWVFAPRQRPGVALAVAIDSAQFDTWARTAFPTQFVDPVNATLVYDATAGEFQVTPSTTGQGVAEPDPRAVATTLADNSGHGSLTLDPSVVQPAVSTQQATTADAWINQRLNQSYTLTSAGTTLYTLHPDEIAALADFSAASTGLTTTFSRERLLALVQSAISQAVSTAPIDRHVLVDSAGTVLRVIQEGTPGRTVADPEALTDTLKTTLEADQAAPVEVAFTEVPPATVETPYAAPAPPAGSERAHWADIDLAAQTVTLMDGPTPTANYLVSTGAPGHATPTGTYRVYSRVPSQTVQGCVGGECYSYDNVKWAVWFNGNIGFHTAYWHNDFGTPVSHGCVNLREADAQAVYDWLSHGSAVVVH